ncbi:uncharacterized protein si:ch73-364h19.1 isoform X2 [Austrofundulus limnaeus]|uniref:Uncharacterized protein si:ch73-364h19.1 isoform X2 n=1 Tax=Austrofundulus limnaeus TaxID=52670 RepID=A0A2I4B3L0_AUSLI|nr:PREDICTED: uncharacterized protein LOC106516490 isoform X2 [Austrofundulus limnaeus]
MSRLGRVPRDEVYAEDMSTVASPTSASSLLTSDQLTVVAASFSSLVFFVIVVVLLSILYRKDPPCCKHSSYQEQHTDMDAPPQYYSSRQTLVGSAYLDQTQITDHSNSQTGELFCVGLPSSYSLPTLENPLPRLPTYESVRKKDRQRQIHMMIADRFGLNGPIVTEPPPTYEESVRQSVELPYDILSPGLDLTPPQSFHTGTGPIVQPDANTSDSRGAVPPAV